MKLEERIHVLGQLSDKINESASYIEVACQKAYVQNKWFTVDQSANAIRSIQKAFLDSDILKNWTSQYNIGTGISKKIGLVLAGNIPLVGWHDIMCCFIAGHQAVIKYSHKDEVLIPSLLKLLVDIDQRTKNYFQKTERLNDIEAIIATGGDTAATHFKYYFGKYPHIIRKNRSSVAILSGDETASELEGLADDIFQYYGLGCRSISKIYVPQDYDLGSVFQATAKYKDLIHHTKYKNNYDYNNAMYLLGLNKFLTNDLIIVLEDTNISSRISCLHYERYSNIRQLETELVAQADQLQCVSTSIDLSQLTATPFGHCQQPSITDYADGIDTLEFLSSLS